MLKRNYLYVYRQQAAEDGSQDSLNGEPNFDDLVPDFDLDLDQSDLELMDGAEDGDAGEPVVDPEEAKATDDGWMPQEAWVEAGKDPKDWVPAREFNFRGQLFSEMRNLKSQLKSVQRNSKKELEDLARKNEAIRLASVRTEREKIMKQLQLHQEEAIEDHDLAKALKLNKEISKHELELQKTQQEIDDLENMTSEDSPEVVAEVSEEMSSMYEGWKAQNTWYGEDPVLRQYSDQAVQAILAQLPQAQVEILGADELNQVLNQAANYVRNAFPGHAAFAGRTKRKSPISPDGKPTSAGGGGRSRYSLKDLSPLDQKIVRELVSDGAVKSVEEYIADLEKDGYFG